MTNEQKFTNAEEHKVAYKAYIEDSTQPIIGQFEWLALEAEEKPELCPFCNGETEIVSCNGGIQVRCTHCGYTSEGYREGKENEAIAAHNRVCRAVKEVKKGEEQGDLVALQ